MEVMVGLRVVRGPDWEGGDEDGGEGFVGTVVSGGRADGAEEGRHDVATVQWDVRREGHSYRCGAQGKYDLRVIDSGAAGVLHAHMGCIVCGSESIAGSVWRCLHCLRYYLCTPCYMKDRHSVWHHFIRIDTPQNTHQRTKVRCRYQSGRVPARGVFPGTTVVRGRDWRWSDQDGGPGKEGTVVEMDGWHSESSRSVAVVEWKESGLRRKYRLGHMGKVDLLCTVPAECGFCYLDHLPLLGAEYKSPTTPFLCAGDRALLEMDLDLLKASLDKIDAWNDGIVDFLGKVGVINNVNLDMTLGGLIFTRRGSGFLIVMNALKKVEGPDIFHDDVVRVIDDIAEVHRLQKDSAGWDDDMALSLGQLGRVVMIEEKGFAHVKVNGRRWVFDTSCVVPVYGEQPEDEMTEMDGALGVELLWLSIQKEPNTEVLMRATAGGCAKAVADMLNKWPEQINARYNGKTLLHVAAIEGRINVAKMLLEHKADIAAVDKMGSIPLHDATHFNHYSVAKLLLDNGSDMNRGGNAGITPLHVAAALGYSRILGLYLEQPNCQVNMQDLLGDTPLHCACGGGWPDAARRLIQAGGDVSLANEQGANVCIHAASKGSYSCMEIIVEAYPGIINCRKINDLVTALHIATVLDNCDALCLLASMDTCNLEVTSTTMRTPLHVACKEGLTRCVEHLVGYGADVTVGDIVRNTPLHYVLGKKNAKPLSGWTPHLNEVHELVSSTDNSIQNVPVYITVACFLISEGASLEVQSMEGLTPVSLCPPDYLPLLRQFAKPERRGHYRGTLPRHPPPVPTPITSQKTEAKDTGSGRVATPTERKAAPPGEKATPTDDSVSGGDSNKTKESGQQPPHNDTHSTSSKDVSSESCFLCEGPCDICFQPCGHTAMCAVCAEPVKRCPTCRTEIVQKIKTTV